MKAFYNNSDRLIAFKGDREPVQIYTKGQLVSNISAVPLSLPTTASGASFSGTYQSEYKHNLKTLELDGQTVATPGGNDKIYNFTEFETPRTPDNTISYNGRNYYAFNTECKVYPILFDTEIYIEADGTSEGLSSADSFICAPTYAELLSGSNIVEFAYDSAYNVFKTAKFQNLNTLFFATTKTGVGFTPQVVVYTNDSINPFNPQTITSTSDVTINLSGVNKFDVEAWEELIKTTMRPNGIEPVAKGEFVEYEGRRCFKLTNCGLTTLWFYLPENIHGIRLTKLTNGGTYQASFAQVRYTDGTVSYVLSGPVEDRDKWLDMKYYNANKIIERFGIYFSANDGTVIYIDLDSIMAEESSTPTPYEPYFGATVEIGTEIEGLQGYSNTLTADYSNNEVSKSGRIRKVVLTGDEQFVVPPPLVFGSEVFIDIGASVEPGTTPICTHFEYAPNPNSTTIGFNISQTGVLAFYGCVLFGLDAYDSGSFSDFARAQYQNGPPITIYYVEQNPTKINLTSTTYGAELLALPTQNTTNIIKATVDTSGNAPLLTAFGIDYFIWGGQNGN